MSQVADHLRSPQSTDADGADTGAARVTFFVAPGRLRWLGYAFYGAGFLLGLVLATGLIELGGEGGRDLVRIIGVVGMVGAVLGSLEVWRGAPFALRGMIDAIRRR